MDDVARYRSLIRETIERYSQFKRARGDVEIEVIFDEANDHYELMHSGWNGRYRIHGSVIHIDIRNEKIIIQFDGTPDAIADQFVAAGVPADRIVLAYKAPEIRPYTGFAVS